MTISRRTLFGAAGAGALALATTTATMTPSVATSTGHLTAYLQTPGQERALLPGGWLQGKVGMAVVVPFTAHGPSADDCTLADLKAANPECVFLAYVNGSVVSSNSHEVGVFETTVDLGAAVANGWVAKYPSGAPVHYDDFPQSAVADLTNRGYRDAFTQLCKNILTTPSRSKNGSSQVLFDGIFLDDTNMSPQHGLDHLRGFGPYPSNEAYGRAMVDFATDIATRLRTMKSSLHAVCNLGADPWTASHTTPALDMASKKFNGTPLFDGFYREFTAYWYPGTGATPLGVSEVQSTVAFADRIASQGVHLYTNEYAPPAANPSTGPTAAEQADWNRRQRLAGGIDLLMGPMTPGGVMTVPYGRTRRAGGRVQSMASPVADLNDPIMTRLMNADAGNQPTGALQTSGSVLHRQLRSGTIYANLGWSPATVNGVSIPARDAVLR